MNEDIGKTIGNRGIISCIPVSVALAGDLGSCKTKHRRREKVVRAYTIWSMQFNAPKLVRTRTRTSDTYFVSIWYATAWTEFGIPSVASFGPPFPPVESLSQTEQTIHQPSGHLDRTASILACV